MYDYPYRRWLPAVALGAAHFVIHFSVPVLDLILHGAFFASLYFGARHA